MTARKRKPGAGRKRGSITKGNDQVPILAMMADAVVKATGATQEKAVTVVREKIRKQAGAKFERSEDAVKKAIPRHRKRLAKDDAEFVLSPYQKAILFTQDLLDKVRKK